MTTLVTGATGFIGANVVRALLAAGTAVRVLVRHGSDTHNLTGLPVEMVHGDVRDQAIDLRGAIDDVRFYSSALSAADILAIAHIGNPNLPGSQPLQPASLAIDASQPGLTVNPLFYGLMIEEINHALDGGLYGELIQNRVS